MATSLDILREWITSKDIEDRAFDVLKNISALLDDRATESDGHDLLLRVLDRRDAFAAFDEVLIALVRRVGLFPYINGRQLSVRDQIALEFHRPLNMPENIVFHAVQAQVYRHLMSGKNVVLSAPTSFGKSLIIDAVVASRKFRNIVVIVPTIALIDETRRRLSVHAASYKLITHATQAKSEANIFILTQERANDREDLGETDFFVIDEFYKLDPSRSDDTSRSIALNEAFYKLWRTGAQFYLLGPSINRITDASDRFRPRIEYEFIRTDYATVAADIHLVRTTKASERMSELVRLAREQSEPTLIYARSPKQANDIANELLAAEVVAPDDRITEAADWVAEQYHPGWTFVRALRAGIGIHHGRLPRALAQFVVRAFNNGRLRYLICTSTLIEGVNTAAKSVMVFDHRIALEKYDFFTFNNIKGRAGRMFRHFVGRVFVFRHPPDAELPSVEIPILSQAESVSEGLLLQLDRDDLTPGAARRLSGLYEQTWLPLDVLRANGEFDPQLQVKLAAMLSENPVTWSKRIGWIGYPKYEGLLAVCELMWDYLLLARQKQASVFSASQLAFKINQLYGSRDVRTLIGNELAEGKSSDEAVEATLHFLRFWPTFNFPNALMALDRIQRSVFERAGVSAGDYGIYARGVEHLFADPAIFALEEYGVPLQVATKLQSALQPTLGLDHVLERLKVIPIDKSLSSFERLLVRDARRHL